MAIPIMMPKKKRGLGQEPAAAPKAAMAPAAPRAAGGIGGAMRGKPTDISRMVADITSDDSVLMRQARTTGLQGAADRGLLSSSMAVQAASGEAYKAAVPIAQTQAELNTRINENRKDRTFESREARRERAFKSGESALDRQLAKDEARLERQFKGSEALKDRRFDRTEAKRDRRFDARQAGADRAFQERIKRLDLDAVDQAKVADMFSLNQQMLEQSIAEIMKNENLDAEEREEQVRKLQDRNAAWRRGIEDIYGVDISFGGGGGRGGGGGGEGERRVGETRETAQGTFRWNGERWEKV